MGRKTKERSATRQQFDLWGNPIEVATPRPKTELVPAEFEEKPARFITNDGRRFWIAVDACRVLGLKSEARHVRERLDDDEVATLAEVCGTTDVVNGLRYDTLLVTEPGLYRLIMESRKPEAKRFKRWVTHEVLPALQKYGTYTVQPKTRIKAMAKRLKCDE
jgi:anti-repressor protein